MNPRFDGDTLALAATDLLNALELDMTFHSRPFAAQSLPEFREAGYCGSEDVNEMRDFLFKFKKSAIAKAKYGGNPGIE